MQNILAIGENRLEPISETQNSASSGFWFYEAAYQFEPGTAVIHRRVVRDDEVCMAAISSSRQMVVEAADPVWE